MRRQRCLSFLSNPVAFLTTNNATKKSFLHAQRPFDWCRLSSLNNQNSSFSAAKFAFFWLWIESLGLSEDDKGSSLLHPWPAAECQTTNPTLWIPTMASLANCYRSWEELLARLLAFFCLPPKRASSVFHVWARLARPPWKLIVKFLKLASKKGQVTHFLPKEALWQHLSLAMLSSRCSVL